VTRLLVVTAVEAEAAALRSAAGSDVVIEVVGVGPAAAAAGTARLLAGAAFDRVVSAGIAGGFPGRAPVGTTVIGLRSVAADLGAETPDGFVPVEQLGFGTSVLHADPSLVDAMRSASPAAVTGDILTLATVTGTAATGATLAARHPAAVAEAMEGYGVATAAAAAGIPFAELRTISNPIGPRDRSAWRIAEALTALTTAMAALTVWADRQSAMRVPGADRG
jgi:futalosine hydrolase